MTAGAAARPAQSHFTPFLHFTFCILHFALGRAGEDPRLPTPDSQLEMFPPHLTAVLDQYGIQPATREALYEQYCMFGGAALEAFADWVSDEGLDPAAIQPEMIPVLRTTVVARYLDRVHPLWLQGRPTPTLYHPRHGEGRGAGAATPLGELDVGAEGVAGDAARFARAIVGEDQPLPGGILILSRNGHFGGRENAVSFDVVAGDLADARLLASAAGRQHTLPGSAGETSGTLEGPAALLWEVQPNALKPEGDRNRAAAPVLRRHRNWHVATLAAALVWLSARCTDIWILRGSSLAVAHEVNPAEPVSATIASLHDRTVERVVDAMNLLLIEPAAQDATALLRTGLMNIALRAAVEQDGAAKHLWKVGRVV